MKATPRFDHLAAPYRWLEYLTFGPLLQRVRTTFLPQLGNYECALLLGDGDGRFAARLLRVNPRVRIYAVDASPRMLQELRKSSGTEAHRIAIETADIRTWRPQHGMSFDLVATHFFLDCLTTSEVAGLAQRLEAVLGPDAVWVVSDFQVPQNRFGRWLAAPLVAILYRAFRLLTGLALDVLPDHAEALASNGWRLDAEHLSMRGLLTSQLWRRDLRADSRRD